MPELDENDQSLDVTITHINYGLLLAGVLSPIPLIVSIIIYYFKRKDIAGTMLESHFDWQALTFWVAFVGFIIGSITEGIGIGYLVNIAISIWLIYRVYMGWRALYEGKKIDQKDTDSK
ncbi:MAG: hypothetical protein HRT87_10625 [Legionellales bacterium]|nr:hypothetical protein [Legionellales bacterium]